GIYGRDGGVVVGNNHPSYGNVMDAVFHYYPIETMRPNDLYWYNDCYGSNGGVTHSPDIPFILPIFVDGGIVPLSQANGHFWAPARPAPREPPATRPGVLPRGPARPADSHLPRGRTQRRGLPHLPGQYPLP